MLSVKGLGLVPCKHTPKKQAELSRAAQHMLPLACSCEAFQGLLSIHALTCAPHRASTGIDAAVLSLPVTITSMLNSNPAAPLVRRMALIPWYGPAHAGRAVCQVHNTAFVTYCAA